MDHKCPVCKKVVAKEDMRFKTQRKLVAVPPATLIKEQDRAPKVKCRCGLSIILLQGSF